MYALLSNVVDSCSAFTYASALKKVTTDSRMRRFQCKEKLLSIKGEEPDN
jgi:hypothetical protein